MSPEEQFKEYEDKRKELYKNFDIEIYEKEYLEIKEFLLMESRNTSNRINRMLKRKNIYSIHDIRTDLHHLYCINTAMEIILMFQRNLETILEYSIDGG